jgi:ABC-type multidrug transport system fused ATPase/permease subunit
MKIFLSKLRRIFRKAPFGIVIVLVFDAAEIILLSLNPFVIGSCIDGFLEHSYSWFYVMLIFQLFLIIIRTTDKIIDTRIYEQIIEDECNNYYKKAIQTSADDSQISSRLNLVDDIISFLEVDLVQIIDMFGGIIFSLVYILFASGLLLFFIAITISVLVYIFTQKYHKKIAQNNINLQNWDETREQVISSRSKHQFGCFTRTLKRLRISNSDLEATAYWWTDVLQLILLISAIAVTIHTDSYTGGELFSIITYTTMLNERVCEINAVRVRIYDLMDSTGRIEGEENEL